MLGRQCVGVTRYYRHSNTHVSLMSALSPLLGRASLFSPMPLSEFLAPPSMVAKYSRYPKFASSKITKRQEWQPSFVYLSVLGNHPRVLYMSSGILNTVDPLAPASNLYLEAFDTPLIMYVYMLSFSVHMCQ